MSKTTTPTLTDTLTPQAVAASGIINQFQAQSLARRGVVFVLDKQVAEEYQRAVREEAATVAEIARAADARRKAEADAEYEAGHARWLARTEREAAEKAVRREAVAASSGFRVV